jgi:predicted membrane-bound mannosyltransferase
MKLKKIIPVLLMAMCISLVMPAFAGNETPVATEKTNNDARAQQLMNRLIEIRDMDKSHLTSFEKRNLRKEVRQIRTKEFILAVGVIIIIVLILILLL